MIRVNVSNGRTADMAYINPNDVMSIEPYNLYSGGVGCMVTLRNGKEIILTESASSIYEKIEKSE